jgi:thermitase
MAQFISRSAARMAALATAAFVFSGATVHAAPSKVVESVPGEFVVELHTTMGTQSISSLDLKTLSQKLGVQVVDRIRDDLVVVRTSSPGEAQAQSLAERLQANPLVAIVEPNYIYQASKTSNDPDLGKTWGIKNTGAADSEGTLGIAGLDIGAEGAWDYTTGSKSVVIAVIDTGIDFGHPDLAPQAWTNVKELNGKVGVDDDGNGYVDDIHGYDFANNKGDSTDDNEHGTHCAGTIGAKGNDGKGIAGVNWDVSLMAVKFLDKKGSGSLANAIKAIDYARKMGAKITSNSWSGGAASELLRKAIEETDKAGMLFIAAAGNEANDNDTTPTYPSTYAVPNVISVAAIDNRGRLASFSNYGIKTVHIAAPGVNVVSTIPGGGYDSFSGTSMATPHVAGVAGLMLANNPNLTPAEVKKQIFASARPLYTLKKRVVTGGMVSAYYALSGLTPPEDPNDPNRLKNVQPATFSTEHNYKDGAKLEHTFSVPGATKIAVRFSKFNTEIGYDTVSFFDKSGSFVGAMSGDQEPGVTSPLILGDTVTVKFAADETNNAYGFDVEAVLSE